MTSPQWECLASSILYCVFCLEWFNYFTPRLYSMASHPCSKVITGKWRLYLTVLVWDGQTASERGSWLAAIAARTHCLSYGQLVTSIDGIYSSMANFRGWYQLLTAQWHRTVLRTGYCNSQKPDLSCHMQSGRMQHSPDSGKPARSDIRPSLHTINSSV